MGYFETLEEGTAKAYKVAEEARKKGHDIELEPEIPLAKNLAERVEGWWVHLGWLRRLRTWKTPCPVKRLHFMWPRR